MRLSRLFISYATFQNAVMNGFERVAPTAEYFVPCNPGIIALKSRDLNQAHLNTLKTADSYVDNAKQVDEFNKAMEDLSSKNRTYQDKLEACTPSAFNDGIQSLRSPRQALVGNLVNFAKNRVVAMTLV